MSQPRSPNYPQPDQAYDPRVTDLSRPLRPPAPRGPGGALDTFRNRTITNTTPIQLVANTVTRVLPRNDRRTGLLIQNRDPAATLFIGFGNAADSTSPSLVPGAFALLDFTCPAGELYFFSTANCSAVVVDMTRGY